MTRKAKENQAAMTATFDEINAPGRQATEEVGAVVETVVEAPQTTTLAVVPDAEVSVSVGSDIRLPSIEKMDEAWTEFTKRQDHFKKLILSRLVQGRDYGFVPGTELKYDEQGNVIAWNGKTGMWLPVNPKQWQAKPSLYHAGAMELRDLFKMLGFPVRSEFDTKRDGDLFVSKCRLFNENTGALVGEATGAFKVGEKGMNENSAIQMADKRSFVAAIRRTLPCVSGLFTQDIEDKDAKPPSKMPETQEPEFGALLQTWVTEATKGSPIAGHKLTKGELQAVRAQIAVWCSGDIPQTPQAAVEWLKANATVGLMENKAGEVLGVKFSRIQEG